MKVTSSDCNEMLAETKLFENSRLNNLEDQRRASLNLIRHLFLAIKDNVIPNQVRDEAISGNITNNRFLKIKS